MLIAVKFLLQLLSEAAAKPPFLAEETFLSEVFASPAFHIFQLDQNELERSASFILTFRASHLVDHFCCITFSGSSSLSLRHLCRLN